MSIKRKSHEYIGQAMLLLFLLLLCFSVIYPMLHVVAVSFSDSSLVLRGEVGIIPKKPTLRAYEYMAQFKLVGDGFRNSIFITLVGTAINLVMTSMTAYALSKKTLVGRKFFMSIILFTMMFTGGLIPNYILVSKLKLIDSLWSVILPGMISAYNMIIMKNFFEAMPEELKESARIDGLSELGILVRIVMPLSMAVMATIGLFYAVAHWNGYFNASIYINTRYKWPLQVVLRDLIYNANQAGLDGIDPGATIPREPLNMAVVTVTTLPILAVYPYLQRYFVKGVMIGSLKG